MMENNVVDLEQYRQAMSGSTISQIDYGLSERTYASGSNISLPPRHRALITNITAACEKAREPGWDGDDAKPVAYLTCYKAIRFIEQLPSNLPPPEIIPDDDGYIELEWYHEGRSFSFYITPSDVVLYAVYYSRNDRSSGRFTFNDALPEYDHIPKNVRQLIREVYFESIAL